MRRKNLLKAFLSKKPDDKKEGEYIKVKNKKYQIEKILHVYEDNLPFFLDDMHQYSNK